MFCLLLQTTLKPLLLMVFECLTTNLTGLPELLEGSYLLITSHNWINRVRINKQRASYYGLGLASCVE